uniref:Ig-like domain-containing protein n=1 Tax=Echeneis naucrates TaxID=173247 RepID=A0A665VJL7_ECHNA
MIQRYIFLVLLCEICEVPAAETSGIYQDSGLIEAVAGETVTLQCFVKGEAVTFLFWYRQLLGGTPHTVATRMKHSEEADISSAYKDRFQVSKRNSEGANHLTINNIQTTDSASYFCGVLEFNAIKFGHGAFLHVKMSEIQAVVYQPEQVPFSSGEPLNLSCTVYAASQCAEEQRLYWFKRGAAQDTVMDPSAGQCTSASTENPHMKNCTANLALASTNSSDAGMYYCALASCGEIVFGNGTKVDIKDLSTKVSPFLVYFLSVALAVSVIILVALAFIVNRLRTKPRPISKGTASHQTFSAPSHSTSHDEDILHYSALTLKKNRGQRQQEDNIENVCVYSIVKNRKQ